MRQKSNPINVRVFLDGREISQSDLSSIVISNVTVDRIVNSVADSCVAETVNIPAKSA